ncbi:hypothetical protein H9Q08_08760 [Chryseobacterium sp. PS-8]|uniref:Uncharacterized protein n=1 Tax=Chryseobacterium indicum TaxID=2766954 RepID=A0ABS9C4B2_9FLAO|nr:hypothetical protein [Chryseobacterium sp. PS-8]MCF2219394.1 hypothetical protein [Chryseobacterium sp. PS-8]
MFSTKHAEYLLSLPKKLKDSNAILDLSQKRNRLEFLSPNDEDQKFLIELTSNEKILLKTSLHHQENNTYVGLLRIDFKGTHINPDHELETLPSYLKPYLGKYFSPEEPHVHIYIEGYRPLSWAIPLSEYDFEVQSLNNKQDIVELVLKFGEKINVISRLNINTSLF